MGIGTIDEFQNEQPELIPANIPPQLTALSQWVAWQYRERGNGGTREKIPISPKTGKNASVSDPATWGTFQEARGRYEKDQLAGIGFVLTDGDDYVCIDIDNCRNARTGELKEDVEWLLPVIQTYVEVSPSGEGLHIWARGKVPRNVRGNGIEIYKSGRFIAVTGQSLDGTSQPEIADREYALGYLFNQAIDRGDESNKEVPSSQGLFTSEEEARIRREAEQGPYGAKFQRL